MVTPTGSTVSSQGLILAWASLTTPCTLFTSVRHDLLDGGNILASAGHLAAQQKALIRVSVLVGPPYPHTACHPF